MTSITLYGGAGEIGGNKILLEDKGVKIYLDFGEPFGFGEDYFIDYLQPYNRGMEVYFTLNLLPRIRKLYNRYMLKFAGMRYEKSDIDAVFISHSHSDHVGHLGFIDEDIPLYLGECTKTLIDIYDEVYPSLQKIGEHNNIKTFTTRQGKIKIKHLEITPVHVEHSVPGAYGFIIKTSKGNIVYTGDFRMHGPMAKLTKEFIDQAAKSKPIALLCEGTRMQADVEHNFTEEEVKQKVDDVTSKSRGLVIGHFSMSNVDRFMTFYNTAVKHNRIMVININFAHIIRALRQHIPALPDPCKDKHIRVYYPLKGERKFEEKDYRKKKDRDYMCNMVTYLDIAKNPKKYLMHMRFSDLMELVYIQPKNADMIYATSEHFYEGEDNEDQRKVWENWMGHFGIALHKAHCSGHMDKKGLIEAIKKINPKVLIPVHTNVPEEFRKVHKNVKVVEAGERLEL